MLQEIADRLNEAGLFACVAVPNDNKIVLTASRIVAPESPDFFTDSNGTRFPVERWERSQLEEVGIENMPDIGNEVHLTDRCDVIEDQGVLTFHNNPEKYMGGRNSMFIQYQFKSLERLSDCIWNYYFGESLRLNDEWHVPINLFPHWNSQRLRTRFDTCQTIGVKSWVHIEKASDLYFRPFSSGLSQHRNLMIRDDGNELYILDTSINEWLAWSKANGLHFH